MRTQQIYNIGTTVYYAGDDINEGGYGRISDHLSGYLDELQLEITLQDGRIISNITPEEFEGRPVLGNTAEAEFKMVESWENGLEDLGEEVSLFDDENSAWVFRV